MTHFLIRLVVNAVALLCVAYLLPGVHATGHAFGSEIGTFPALLVAALIFGVVNAILWPILMILTLPLQVLTLGLFTLIVNGFIFWFVGQFDVGIAVNGFLTAVIGALVMAIVSFILSTLLRGVTDEA